MNKDSAAKAKRCFEKGRAARELGRYKSARNCFVNGARWSEPKYRASYWIIAANCDELRGDLRGAISFLRRAERLAPNVAFIQTYIGRIQTDLGRLRLAERALRKSVAIKPKATAYIFLGIALGRLGRTAEAKQCFRSALELEPENEEAHFNLGICYEQEDRLDESENHFRRAVEIDRKYAIAHAELGSLLISKGHYSEARKHLRRSIRIEPERDWPRLRLAVANWFLRRLKEAEEQYSAAVRISPNDAFANVVFGDFLSAERRDDPGRYLTKALSLAPNDASVLYFVGKHMLRDGCERDAIGHFKRAARKGHIGAQKQLEELSANNG